MKLRNKKTGEIIIPTDYTFATYDDGIRYGHHIYYSLAELNEDWEDYEEPKDIWWLDNEGRVNHASGDFSDAFRKNREIGNYFLSREEAEKAVEKLKAWERLKDKGFRFNWVETFSEGMLEIGGVLPALKGADNAERSKMVDDLHLIFGEEEG